MQDTGRTFLKLICGTSQEDITRAITEQISDKNGIKDIYISMIQLQNLDLPRHERRMFNRSFMASLAAALGGMSEAQAWMRINLHPASSKTILADERYKGTTIEKIE